MPRVLGHHAVLLLATIITASSGWSATTSTPVTYDCDGTSCSGVLVSDDSWTSPRPAVLVVHDWMGITARTEAKAANLVNLGYVAFCVDVYGAGVRPTSPAEAGKQAGRFKDDRPLMRARMKAGLDALLHTGKADPKHVAAIGYCFGGTCVLELGYTGAPIAALVTFHGGLGTPTPQDASNILGKVLILHGADDPYVKPDEVQAFEQEMRATKVDWELVQYGNTVHGFTDSSAPSDNSKGYAYNAESDRRSWQAMRDLFAQTISAPGNQ